MKKCSYCGLENPADAAHCRQCQKSLEPPLDASSGPHPAPQRKMLPGLLSYFLVASAAFLFEYLQGQRSGVPFPPHFLVLNTVLPADELLAKLAQVGVPKDAIIGALAPNPPVLPALLHHFAFFAVVLFAFWALTKLFARLFSK